MAKRASKAKPIAPKREKVLSIPGIPGVPEDIVSQLLESLRAAGPPSWEDDDGVDDLETAFQDFLDLGDPEENDEEADEVFSNLSDRLDEVRVRANGGNTQAREALQAFHARLDEAIADEEIHPANLIMLGKVLWIAQLPVGDNLRAAVGEGIGGEAALAPENAENMTELALRAVDQFDDPFDLYNEVASNMAAFPTDVRITLAMPLVTSGNIGARMAAIGFVLHPDEDLARAVIKGFPFSAAPSDAENAIVDRLDLVAAWLAPGRRELADAAFAAMRSRPRATPATAKNVVRLLASAHDGSGSDSLMAIVKTGRRFLGLSILMKAQGVIEVVAYDNLSRKDADRMTGLMGASSPTLDVSEEGAAELLGLALGRNISAGSPPPFRLVQFCGAVGWQLRPDLSSAAQICEKMLADSPIDADLAARAPSEIVSSPFVESWFEAGECVEKLLGATKSRKLAIGKVLRELLPSRRPFWARLCASSAVVFRARAGGPDEAWKPFALVGSKIASETPLDRIPLMVHIATRTVEVHFDQS